MNVCIVVPEMEIQVQTNGPEWKDVPVPQWALQRCYEILAERHADELEEIARSLYMDGP